MKIGTDPEFFIQKDGRVISAIGVVGGSKKRPIELSNICSVHEDNVAMELNVCPAESEDELLGNVTLAIKESLAHAGEGVSIHDKSLHRFDEASLDNPKARRSGCSGERDAVTGLKIPSPRLNRTNDRCVGGHIHVSIDDDMKNRKGYLRVVSMMDLFLGVPSVVLDEDRERRRLYGKSSSFRPKPYGLEYRVLSNFWLLKEEYIRWVFRNTEIAVESAKKMDVDMGLIHLSKSVIDTYNEHDARVLIEQYNIPMP